MSCMLVFYFHNHCADVIHASAAPEGAVCGDVIKVRRNGSDYEAKVRFQYEKKKSRNLCNSFVMQH